MWLVFVLLAGGALLGFVAGDHVFCGKPKWVEWERLPVGQYHVVWINADRLVSGVYRFLLYRVRVGEHKKHQFLEISGCPPDMKDLVAGDTFEVTPIRKQKIPAHKELNIYH